MSANVLLLITIVGGAGAVCRVLLTGLVASLVRRDPAWGTLTVNVIGAFGLGVLVGTSPGADVHRIVATGFVGALTTFSTWMFESARLGHARRSGTGALNVVVSIVVGVAAAWAGRRLGLAL